jgi:hypothetical protein
MTDKCFMILGGGGMIGIQVAYRIARKLKPEKIVIVSLHRDEVQEALHEMRRDFPNVNLVGFDGDIFVRSELSRRDQRYNRQALLENHARRAELYDDLFGDLESAYQRSQLVQLILEHRPDVIVDCINTATAISYQDVYTASKLARRDLDSLLEVEAADSEGAAGMPGKEIMQSFETLLISQYTPQLIRHVVMINRAMREVRTRLYIKIGTTGTGGMGLNIPYTHGEDKPSAKLMSKNAIAFAHTGLLFLMARTEGGPIVKEIKPAAMVGWIDVTRSTIKQRGEAVYIYACQSEELGEKLNLRRKAKEFERLDKLQMVVADTGENGVFTKGEFEAITALRQMEFMTPEEIARVVELEISGINTGKDVISAIDGAVMGPTYRAGYLRHQALDELARLEEETGIPSVALGELGPPELSKLLWEAFLIKECYPELSHVLECGPDEVVKRHPVVSDYRRPPEELSQRLHAYLQGHAEVQNILTSTKIPILLPDGKTILRGPAIRIPETPDAMVDLSEEDIDRWATKGWVDLRPQNMRRWQERCQQMLRSREGLHGKGSAAYRKEVYPYSKIYIGEVVGWVFNNEMGGYRIK